MEKYKLLRKTIIQRQRGCLLGIFLLIAINSLCLFSSLTLLNSGRQAVSSEMRRLGFGNLTVWVTQKEEELQSAIQELPEVSKVSVQPLVFAGYKINGAYSDDEGQLLTYTEEVPYHFISERGEVRETSRIQKGTIYISPALASSFEVKIGDTISFELSRKDGNYDLTVAGYFEDAFMGSSMIDRKSFLISEEDREDILTILEEAKEYDVLGKKGAMLHIFQDENSLLSEKEFQKLILTDTALAQYTEFSYSFASILSYMLLLQNIMTGFLIAFSMILLVICFIVISHSLSAVIEQNKKDMAILKTIGFTGKTIRLQYLLLYGGTVLCGFLLSLLPAFWIAGWIARGMISSTGLLIQVSFDKQAAMLLLPIQLLLFLLFIYFRSARILRISPMQTIREAGSGKLVHTALHKRGLPFFIAVRELLSGKSKYIGICLISLVLVMFLSVVGKMGAWLGRDGEGLMNAFSVADHDLGVEPFNERVPMEEIERVINWYSPIQDTYELAMQSVTLNGQEYTANILNDVKWFHVLQGTVCDENSILITDTIANEQGLKTGDTILLTAAGRTAEFKVSGIYQCANGMGSNIGMNREGYRRIGDVSKYIWCHHYILEDGSVREYAMKYIHDHYRGIDVHTNRWSGLDGIVFVMKLLILVIYLIAALFIFISVYLTASKLLQSETGNMAIYKSLGIPSNALRLSFALRFLLVVSIGAGAGAVLAALTADSAVGVILKRFGIGSFTSGNPFLGTILPPVAVMLFFFIFAWTASARLKKISLVQLINKSDN